MARVGWLWRYRTKSESNRDAESKKTAPNQEIATPLKPHHNRLFMLQGACRTPCVGV